jgi:hypothetical protein
VSGSRRLIGTTIGAISIACTLAPPAGAAVTGRRAAPVAIEVHPESVSLEGALDHQRILVHARFADGTVRDITDDASLTLADGIATLTNATASPARDGEGTISIAWSGLEAAIPITVRNAGVTPPPSFQNDVIPAMTGPGCNSGGCHGSARGKDGFHLSLFGFDPTGDLERVVRELPGRRIDLAAPHRSLLLEKATGAVPHTGGRRFDEGDEAYRAIHRWIAAGAPRERPDAPRLVAVEMGPGPIVLRVGDAARLAVTARYDDGTDRDATSLSILRSSNETVASTDRRGVLRTGMTGETFVTATFGDRTVGLPVIVLPETDPADLDDPAADAPANEIDAAVGARLRDLRLRPSPLCDDVTFVRRVHLDLVGRLPTPDEIRSFTADGSPEKRTALVDRLLADPAFARLNLMEWSEILAIRSDGQRISPKAALGFHGWLRGRFEAGDGIDAIVRDILTAEGGTFTSPATNYFEATDDEKLLAENVAQSFLGIRIQCAQCHNHPFDRWTQNDYYGFVAHFAQLGRKGAEDQRERIVFDRGRGETKHPVGGADVPPKPLGEPAVEIGRRDRREVLADWLVDPENPFFARSMANRLWARFFGRGIVEPVDDFRISNPPSNPALLDLLARRLVETGYDFRALARDICTSRTYQRATASNETNARDDANFSRATLRRIRAEVLLDCICQITEAPEKLPGLPLGSRAVEIADGARSTYFLDTFGRSPRRTVCSCEVSTSPSLSQALHLINGETVSRKIEQGGVVARALASGATPDAILDDLAFRSLGRSATETEHAALLAPLAEPGVDPRPVLEDAFWAFLNSREFLFNH